MTEKIIFLKVDYTDGETEIFKDASQIDIDNNFLDFIYNERLDKDFNILFSNIEDKSAANINLSKVKSFKLEICSITIEA